MIINIIFKQEFDDYNIELSDNIFFSSLISEIIPFDSELLKDIRDTQGRLVFELKTREYEEVSLEDRMVLYDIYNTVYKNQNEIKDFQLINSESNNILISFDMLKLQIDEVLLSDRSFHNAQLNNNQHHSLILRLFLVPYEENSKEESEE